MENVTILKRITVLNNDEIEKILLYLQSSMIEFSCSKRKEDNLYTTAKYSEKALWNLNKFSYSYKNERYIELYRLKKESTIALRIAKLKHKAPDGLSQELTRRRNEETCTLKELKTSNKIICLTVNSIKILEI